MEQKNKYWQLIPDNYLYALFFLPYLGSGVPAYVICIIILLVKMPTLKLKGYDLFFLTVILLWLVLKLFQSDGPSVLILLRYYFGFYIFYLFFNNNSRDNFNLEKLLVLLCWCVIAEAVLVNTVIRPQWLPNYPKGTDAFQTAILGFYQRPYSIGTNSSITSTLIMVLLFSVHMFRTAAGEKIPRKIMLLASGAIVLLASGVGFMIYFLFLVYRVQPFKNLSRSVLSILIILTIYSLIFIVDIGKNEGLEKISSAYINFLLDFKEMQIDDVYSHLFIHNNLWIGEKFNHPSELIIWNDFAWNDLFACTGYFGLGIIFAIFLAKFNRFTAIPLVIFMLGTLHYSALFSLPGQMLAGYFFSTPFKARMCSLKVRQMHRKKLPHLALR